MTTPYARVEDMPLGDILLSDRLDKQTYIEQAADEIDAILGWTYITPLQAEGGDFSGLPRHQKLLIKKICYNMAAGKLIMAQAIASEDGSLNAYGSWLHKTAQNELNCVANGEISLDAERNPDAPSAAQSHGPGIFHEDEESLQAGFVNTVLRQEPWITRPGHSEL